MTGALTGSCGSIDRNSGRDRPVQTVTQPPRAVNAAMARRLASGIVPSVPVIVWSKSETNNTSEKSAIFMLHLLKSFRLFFTPPTLSHQVGNVKGEGGDQTGRLENSAVLRKGVAFFRILL